MPETEKRQQFSAPRAGLPLARRVATASLIWWAIVFSISCLTDVAALNSSGWLPGFLADVVGSLLGLGWSFAFLAVLGGRSAAASRAEPYGLGLAGVLLGAVVCGLGSAVADCGTGWLLGVKRELAYSVLGGADYYFAMCLAWFFLYLLVGAGARALQLQAALSTAEEAALAARNNDLVRILAPASLSHQLSTVAAAIDRRDLTDTASLIDELSQGLRAALEQVAHLFQGDADAQTGAERALSRNAVLVARRFLWVTVGIWGLVLAVALSTLPVANLLDGRSPDFEKWFLFAGVGLVGSGLTGALLGMFRLEPPPLGLARLILAVFLAVPATAAAALCLSTLLHPEKPMWGGNFLYYLFNYAFVFAAWCVFFRYSAAVRREMAQLGRLADARQAALVARTAMLRYQVRPHFLFNALNALLALALDGRWAEAQAMTAAVSRFAEVAFSRESREFVPIGEQVDALSTYLSIEKVRFGERLSVRVEVPQALSEALAPTLILQPLVENAMKHAVATTADPVEVEISVRRERETLILEVRDSGGDPEAPPAPGLGVGLRNISARLAGHYEGRASLRCERLTPRGFVGQINLPFGFA